MPSSPARELVDQALAGRAGVLESLIDRLTPIIQARVARVLLARRPAAARATLRQQLEDLSQEVFLHLFAHGGRVLRMWQPERGLSLDNFVGLVAERRAISWLRADRARPWEDDAPTLDEEAEEPASGSDPELRAASREELRLLLDRLRQALSPLGWHLFDLLFVQERPLEEVERRTRMSRDALYAWRSRLRRLARRLFGEILSEGS